MQFFPTRTSWVLLFQKVCLRVFQTNITNFPADFVSAEAELSRK